MDDEARTVRQVYALAAALCERDGAALAGPSQPHADEALALLLEHGVNHVDTAASYGASEQLIGDWIRRHGRPSFLATKTEQRERAAAREQVLRSLERLQVDRVD